MTDKLPKGWERGVLDAAKWFGENTGGLPDGMIDNMLNELLRDEEGLPSEESISVQLGHKNGRIILNLSGTSHQEPTYIAFTPTQAREFAQQILVCADGAESKP